VKEADWLRLTVAVEGETATEMAGGGVTVTELVAVTLELLDETAVTITAWFEVTEPATAEKLALLAPARTVRLVGTLKALVLLVESEKTPPPVGAA
jgi:hypothetical protein